MSTSGGGKNLRCSSVLVVQVYVQFWVVQLIMKCDFVECIKNSRNKNNINLFSWCFLLILLFTHLSFPSFLLCHWCYLLTIEVSVTLKLCWLLYPDSGLKWMFTEEYKRACTEQCFLWHCLPASDIEICIAN